MTIAVVATLLKKEFRPDSSLTMCPKPFLSPTGLPSALHTTWSYRRRSNCFRNRTCKTTPCVTLICRCLTPVKASLLFSLGSLQLLDRAAEETTSYCEDLNNESQHNQHLCYGTLFPISQPNKASSISVWCCIICFSSLSVWFLSFRCSCSRSVSSSSRQWIHLAEAQNRRKCTHPLPVRERLLYLHLPCHAFVIHIYLILMCVSVYRLRTKSRQ